MTSETRVKSDPRPQSQESKTEFKEFAPDVAEKLTLLKSMLLSAASVDVAKLGANKPEVINAYNQLHHSFRNLMQLRGKAFLEGFSILIKTIADNPNGIFYPSRVNKQAGDMIDPVEREVFIIFINMAVRFAGTKDKARFGKMNNIERLASRMADPELADLIRHVFPE